MWRLVFRPLIIVTGISSLATGRSDYIGLGLVKEVVYHNHCVWFGICKCFALGVLETLEWIFDCSAENKVNGRETMR